MRRLQLGLVLVACALSAVPRAQNTQRPGEAAPTGLLMGVIIDPLDRQPVPNAEVEARRRAAGDEISLAHGCVGG